MTAGGRKEPRRARIAVVGGYGTGQTLRVGRIPAAGETLTATSLECGHGGKGSNQAVAITRLGADAALFTAVGRDAAGQAARDLWAAEGVDARAVVAGDQPTMTGVILVEPAGENRIVIAPGALATLTPADVDAFRPQIRLADLLVVSLEIPPAVGFRALRIAREEKVRTLLNPAPAAVIDDAVWNDADFLTPNRSEARVMAGLRDSRLTTPDHVMDVLRSRTRAGIALTLGGAGVLVDEAGKGRHQVAAAPAGNVLDTTGAGDSFTAALAVALCCGASLADAAAWAAHAGAHTVGRAGVIPALPCAAQLPQLPRIMAAC